VLHAEAEFVRADVRREDDVRGLVEKTVARFGRIDVAINNACTEGKSGPVTEQTAEGYAQTFDTNVLGTLLSMKYELRVMQPQGQGSVINVSSVASKRASPGASVYSASKSAVEALTKAAAHEAARFGIRVNAVSPGPIETGMLDRFTGTPDGKARFISETVPLNRAGALKRSPRPSLFWPQTRLPSSPDRSSASTAAKGPDRLPTTWEVPPRARDAAKIQCEV
jgi:NAD(P)-dependent dehydrogenase (short-subunit alcohol dehydrogenase family)